jgi:hypothetical protein
MNIRRGLFLRHFCAMLVFLMISQTIVCQHPTPRPPTPKASPNAPTNQNIPQGLETRPAQSAPELANNPQADRDIRMDVQRLYALVTQLKDEVDGTDANLILNVSLVKKANEIEKLAKQIKSRVKR